MARVVLISESWMGLKAEARVSAGVRGDVIGLQKVMLVSQIPATSALVSNLPIHPRDAHLVLADFA